MHVSTAYSNSDRYDVQEVIYPMPLTLESARYIAEQHSYDEGVINKLMGKSHIFYRRLHVDGLLRNDEFISYY